MFRTSLVAAALASTAAVAVPSPALAAPRSCSTAGLVCATADIRVIGLGCVGPDWAGYYDCSWRYDFTFSGTSPLPGTARATVYYDHGAISFSCSWTTGGCVHNGSTAVVTRWTRNCDAVHGSAQMYVDAGSTATGYAYANDSDSITYDPYC